MAKSLTAAERVNGAVQKEVEAFGVQVEAVIASSKSSPYVIAVPTTAFSLEIMTEFVSQLQKGKPNWVGECKEVAHKERVNDGFDDNRSPTKTVYYNQLTLRLGK